MTRYHGKLAEMVPTVGKTWDEEWKPAVIASNVPLKTADWSTLSDAELVAKLDELTDQMRHQWWIHGHINFVLLSSSAFCDLYDGTCGRTIPPSRTRRSTASRPPPSTPAAGCGPSAARFSPARRSRSSSRAPSPRDWAALDASEEGRAFRQQLDDFLFDYGWRHDAVYDLADVPWRENPAIPLASIAKGMELDESEEVTTSGHRRRRSCSPRPRPAGRRARDARQLRRALRAGALQLPAHRGPRLLHRPALHQRVPPVLPRRRRPARVAKGVVDQPDDVFYLYRDEVVDAPHRRRRSRAMVADRRASMDRRPGPTRPGARHAAPAPDAPDPFMDALVSRLLGFGPPKENLDPGTLMGVAGAPGAYTGRPGWCDRWSELARPSRTARSWCAR